MERSSPYGLRKVKKVCTKCGIEKELELFDSRKGTRDKRRSECKKCRALYHILRTYGLSSEAYRAMLKRADGTCEICEDFEDPLVLDHDHDTDFTRGLLCQSCNLGLGHFQDDVERLQSAIIYLKRED